MLENPIECETAILVDHRGRVKIQMTRPHRLGIC